MSTELYLRLYLERNGPVRARAVVTDVKERFFDVIDLSMRTVGRVYVDVSSFLHFYCTRKASKRGGRPFTYFVTMWVLRLPSVLSLCLRL